MRYLHKYQLALVIVITITYLGPQFTPVQSSPLPPSPTLETSSSLLFRPVRNTPNHTAHGTNAILDQPKAAISDTCDKLESSREDRCLAVAVRALDERSNEPSAGRKVDPIHVMMLHTPRIYARR